MDVPPEELKNFGTYLFGNILLKNLLRLTIGYIIMSKDPPTFPVLMPLSELFINL